MTENSDSLSEVVTTTPLDFEKDDTDLSQIPAFLRKGENAQDNVHTLASRKSAKSSDTAKSSNEEEEESVPEIQPEAGGKGGMDKITIDDLKRQEEEIQRQIAEKLEEQKRSVLDQIVTVVKSYEITTEEVVEALGGMKIKRKGVKAKQKYQDPATGATWSGRGKEPAWIKGKDRKKFLIQSDGD